MRLLAGCRSTLAVVLRRRAFEDDVSDELRFHLDAYADDLMRGGVSRGRGASGARGSSSGAPKR